MKDERDAKRLVYAIDRHTADGAEIARLAAFLCYEPQQLKKDIAALIRCMTKEEEERE